MDEIEHWSHPHPLALRTEPEPDPTDPNPNPNPDKNHPKCYGCERPIDGGDQLYTCEPCNFHLHKPCADLVSSSGGQIRHPFHPPHPLTLRLAWRRHDCIFCHSYILGFNLCCDACGFYLDSRCASVCPTTVKYRDRGHLYFLKEEAPNVIYHCDMCKGIGNDTWSFQCVVPGCFKAFHFHCAPLPFPKMIKSKCHFHPVTLVESYVQDWHEDQYCDACEEPRNPKLRVYYCAECDFAAHISCTVNEVLPSIIEEYEKEAKVREDLEKDAGLQRIDWKIYNARSEEERIVKKLEKIAARLDVLRSTRAEYIASKLSDVDIAESSNTSAELSAH